MATEWLELNTPPALPGLFLRAALRRRVTGRTLPSCGLRTHVAVDAGHLARYRQLCGFADNGLLPASYPHLLAFPVQMRLLTDPGFPFPLLGLVHLENRIRVLRPLGGLGPFNLSLEANNLQPHDKGAVFSVVARLEDQLGLLWEGDSRLLCRALKLDGPVPEHSEPPPPAQTEIARWHAPSNIGRRYARLSGDYNPIHLSALSARLFGFPRAIAHGLWNKARTLAALHAHLPEDGYAIEVRFRKPLLLPGAVHLLASEPATEGHFEVQGQDGTPHMVGRWRPR